MNAWQELVRQALIGNISNKKISPLLIEQFNSYGLHLTASKEPEKILLKAAAIQNKLYTSAQIPLSVSSEISSTTIAPEEDTSYCNNQRRYQLQYVLKHKYDEILQEILTLLIHKNLIVIPDLLPELLYYGSNRPQLHAAIKATIGHRGIWLAQFTDQWSYAQHNNTNDEVFFYGKQDERAQFFQSLRQRNPAAALALLEQVWDSESFMIKANFIRLLRDDLSSIDEPFLETALQDNRQEVRREAAVLLALLPKSNLVSRMQTLAKSLITYEAKKDRITVELPASCTKKMKQDGILPRQISIKDHGPKANQLAQIISKIPPKWWENTLNKSPKELLVLVTKTEWKNVFVWGWAMAAKNFHSEGWIIACHQFYLKNFFKYNWSNFSIDFLYKDLPNNLFNALAEEYLKTDQRSTLSDNHPVVSFLLAEGQKWDQNITKKVIQRIKNTIEQDTYVFHWSLKTVLKRAAFSIPPNLYDTIKEGWPTQSHAWHSWQKEVDSMLSILKIRQEIQLLED